MELAKNLKTDPISRLHPTAPRQVESIRPISDAVALMRQERVGCVLVTEQGRLIGIFTERDYLARVLAVGGDEAQPIASVMTREPLTVGPREPILRAIRRMTRGGYRHLPVVDDDDRAIGILSVRRIVHYLVEHFPAAVYNLPPDPNAIPRDREGP